jgi:L-amino acid N-acyltransferase YncA
MMRIRLATPDDGGALSDIYRPAVADRATSFEVDPPDAAEMARRVAATLEHYPWLVCEDSGQAIGYAYASRHRERAAYQWAVEVSAYVRDGVHRKGVGRRLYGSLFRVLALQGYQRAFAGITLPNEASVGFHEALGFSPVGVYHRIGWKCGAWHDVMWLERAVAENLTPPDSPPTPLTGLPPASLAAAIAGPAPTQPC